MMRGLKFRNLQEEKFIYLYELFKHSVKYLRTTSHKRQAFCWIKH